MCTLHDVTYMTVLSIVAAYVTERDLAGGEDLAQTAELSP